MLQTLMAVATPRWHTPRVEPQELHRELLKTKKAQSYQRFCLLLGARVLAALNLLGPGDDCHCPSCCLLLLLLHWESSEISGLATGATLLGLKQERMQMTAQNCPLCWLLHLEKPDNLFCISFGSVQVGIADPAVIPSLLSDVFSATCDRFKGGSTPYCVLCIPYILIPNCFAFATSAVLQQCHFGLGFFFFSPSIFSCWETDPSLNLLKPGLFHGFLYL